MKIYFRLSALYAVLALIGGVFFREFTKFNKFTGTTSLSLIHTHAFVLGMFFFLILLLLNHQFQLTKSKKHKPFLIIYNAGLLLTYTMLCVRGIAQVLDIPLKKGIHATISGIAGIGHILLGVGLLFFFLILKERFKNVQNS